MDKDWLKRLENDFVGMSDLDHGESDELELHVRIKKIWHRVKDKQVRLTFCDRTYDPTAELAFKELEVGLIVCPSCYEVERPELS